MRFFILIFILSFIFSQHPIQTKEYQIYKDDKVTKINVLELINENNVDGLFQVDIIGVNNAKYERKKITLVMPCELEMTISSDLSQSSIDFKVCKDRISMNSTLLIDKNNQI